MYRKTSNDYDGEGKAIVKFLLQGHTRKEAADEFGISVDTVKTRVKSQGYTCEGLRDYYQKQRKPT